jgi:ribosomal protein S9
MFKSSTNMDGHMQRASVRTLLPAFCIKPGSGKVTVNGRDIEVYFARPVLRMILQQPLVVSRRLWSV